jgi:hypothetical protein
MIESCPKCRSDYHKMQSVKLWYRDRFFVRCGSCNYRSNEQLTEEEAIRTWNLKSNFKKYYDKQIIWFDVDEKHSKMQRLGQ